MARNVEKGRSMLNQWLKAKELSDKKSFFKIPKRVHEVDDLESAESYRKYIIKEICSKIKEIQNYSLSDQHIRELNDQINKLISIKNKWEIRIIELGGPDYQTESNTLINAHCSELKGNNNYKYFGAAKNLKGVRELLFKESDDRRKLVLKKKKEKRNLEKFVNIHYFGYCDDENEILLKEELKIQKKLEKNDLKILKRIRSLKNNN
ncbi:pre-mRNA-splicing factor ISY1 [Plasmodium brasilianum]|uniref:Pre-mRNA-splicing factor ISY1, putative n=2 Tax=Plasmodium (Plasmodium) TaxID=418103 RepID=A0A1A8X953_PLAMA|nr:pre-mRNA-splicing factor ISY1, putative [Plasmodium malariae]KAI4836578.1 pre-mRNA-splicing factor ISY1 [Plasmodium brasilianum]SBT01135.1 pre-mRNA-splicing factor ISY1, putative [Plasmodium malariae]SCO93852.1 pre-mRNA-splicing factor ISY1, putative [Plasmodium malariae]